MADQPLIILVGAAATLAPFQQPLETRGYRTLHITERNGYIARLADLRPVLVLVSTAQDDDTAWRFWVAAAKTSPATRRIPVVVLGDDDAEAAARQAGVDDVCPPTPDAETLDLILSHVRTPVEPGDLADACAEPLPPDAQEAVRRFNAGDYYRQHDLFEALWMAETRPIRDLYRAVLQVGIAYYQLERGNGRGAYKMLLRAVQWLEPLPDVCQTVNIARLRADAAVVRSALESADYDAAGVDRALLRGVEIVGEGQGL